MIVLAKAIDRFRADLAQLLPEGLRTGEPLALAVSGGPDSMAMLVLAATALPTQVVAATVDHGLRAAAAVEARLVAAACETLGVPHATLSLDRAITAGNLHDRARAARYAVLGRWAVNAGARVLATAHHADDQAETFLMRAVRGAGPAGLAAIRQRRTVEVQVATAHPMMFDVFDLTIVRPLLYWQRTELGEIIAASGLTVATDPSNTDDRFERTRVRRLMAEAPWLDPAGLARAARHVDEANAALDAMHDWLWQTRKVVPTGVADPDDQIWLDIADLPRELQRRLTREAIRWVRIVNGIMPDFDLATNIEPLLDAVVAGRAATQADILVSPRGSIWRFSKAPPRRDG